MLRKIVKTVDRTLSFVEEWILFGTVSIALVAAMANIVLRKTTNLNLVWSDEVVRKVIFVTTYIGASAAIRSRSLIRIDAVPQLIPGLKKPLTFLSHLAVLVFSVLIIRLGLQTTLSTFQDPTALTVTLQIPEWIFYAVLPLMGVMMFLRTLIVMVEDWRSFGSDPA